MEMFGEKFSMAGGLNFHHNDWWRGRRGRVALLERSTWQSLPTQHKGDAGATIPELTKQALVPIMSSGDE